jgi:hypothetical protein
MFYICLASFGNRVDRIFVGNVMVGGCGAFSPLPQYPRHFLQRPAHPQQLVFAEDDEAFIVRIVGQAYELDDFRIDRDFLASCVGPEQTDPPTGGLTTSVALGAPDH